MRLLLAALADYATTDRHDKLTVCGIFRSIAAPDYPATHPSLTIAIQLEPEQEDLDGVATFSVRIVSPDGKPVGGQIEGEIDLHGAGTPPPVLNLLLGLRELQLITPGPYTFELTVNGKLLHEMRLDAVRVPS